MVDNPTRMGMLNPAQKCQKLGGSILKMTELMGSFVGLKIEICDEVDKMGLK